MKYTSKSDLEIYRIATNHLKSGVVSSFEYEILEYLATHKDKEFSSMRRNYLDTLNSHISTGKCYRFARYVALGMTNPFRLCEGYLTNLYNGKFTHAWIETEDSVYDVTFTGKWSKDLYYEVFAPKIEKIIDLETDEKFNEHKANTVPAPISSSVRLEFIDWYTYRKAIETTSMYGHGPSLPWYYHKKLTPPAKTFTELVQARWQELTSEPIPEELTSEELNQLIEKRKFIKTNEELSAELVQFIVSNLTLYEEKKHIRYDISLWKKAIEGKYSGSLCELISNIPLLPNMLKNNNEMRIF